jgi:hypothetical protein
MGLPMLLPSSAPASPTQMCWHMQTELENVLFSIIRAKGFDEQYIDCYRMVTQFYQQRQPLCIIICGTAWTGGQQQGADTAAKQHAQQHTAVTLPHQLQQQQQAAGMLLVWCGGQMQGTCRQSL